MRRTKRTRTRNDLLSSRLYKHSADPRNGPVIIKNGPPNPRYATRKLRSQVFNHDRGICQYCGHKVSYQSFNVEHVIPWPDGLTRLGNLVTACQTCNKTKLRQYLFNPGKPGKFVRRPPALVIRNALKERLIKRHINPATFNGF